LEISALIVRFARENCGWGYCRIEGALRNVGHRVAPTTIRKVLKEHGIKPAPDRPTSWRAFLKSHWNQIAGTDFFTTQVWTATGLKTYHVLFLIELDTRRVHLAGITRHPNDMWMGFAAERAARFLRGRRFLVCDRDSEFRYRFKIVLEAAGIKLVKTPYQAPNANAHAERFVRSIKTSARSTTTTSETTRGSATGGSTAERRRARETSMATNASAGCSSSTAEPPESSRPAGPGSGGGGVSLTWPASVFGREIAAMFVTSSRLRPG
jgi:hypothetical protein